MIILKVADYDMIWAWKEAIKEITGFDYKISKHNPGGNSGAHRQQWKLRVAQQALVFEAEEVTVHKTKIPDGILTAENSTKVAFVQGLMDSEGWINLHYGNGMGQCDLTLGFGCGDPWFDDFYSLVHSLGILTSKVYKRKPTIKKDGSDGKTLSLFKIDIPSYINAGLSFTIKRKADRLAFCSRILNDYTCHYPRYEDYYIGQMI
jgi:hypothetical protein